MALKWRLAGRVVENDDDDMSGTDANQDEPITESYSDEESSSPGVVNHMPERHNMCCCAGHGSHRPIYDTPNRSVGKCCTEVAEGQQYCDDCTPDVFSASCFAQRAAHLSM